MQGHLKQPDPWRKYSRRHGLRCPALPLPRCVPSDKRLAFSGPGPRGRRTGSSASTSRGSVRKVSEQLLNQTPPLPRPVSPAPTAGRGRRQLRVPQARVPPTPGTCNVGVVLIKPDGGRCPPATGRGVYLRSCRFSSFSSRVECSRVLHVSFLGSSVIFRGLQAPALPPRTDAEAAPQVHTDSWSATTARNLLA